MAENASQQKKTELINPFCRQFVPVKYKWDPDQAFVFRVKTMEVNRETLVAVPVYDKIDLVAEINACRELCGLEYMKAQLARGLAKPEDFIAKPSEFGDTTVIPQDVHTAKKMADMGNDELAKLAKIIGIKPGENLTPQLFEERLKDYISANWHEPETTTETK